MIGHVFVGSDLLDIPPVLLWVEENNAKCYDRKQESTDKTQSLQCHWVATLSLEIYGWLLEE